MYGGIIWESIAESLNQGTLLSTLYFTFELRIIEGHTRYLKNELLLGWKEIDESDEILESFIPLQNRIAYCFNNDYN
jgi:hypothetical protein